MYTKSFGGQKGQVENAEMLKRKYGNGSMETEVRKPRACCSPLTDKPFLEEGPMQRSNRNSSKTLEAVFFFGSRKLQTECR